MFETRNTLKSGVQIRGWEDGLSYPPNFKYCLISPGNAYSANLEGFKYQNFVASKSPWGREIEHGTM